MDADLIIQAVQEIRAVLRNSQGGCMDEDARQRVQLAARRALTASDRNGYILEKVVSIEGFANALYSYQGFMRYDTPQRNGAERLRSDILIAAGGIEEWALQWDLCPKHRIPYRQSRKTFWVCSIDPTHFCQEKEPRNKQCPYENCEIECPGEIVAESRLFTFCPQCHPGGIQGENHE